MPTIVITRTRVYPSVAHPGPAWKWVYTVAIPGEPYTFAGEGLHWVQWLAKKKAPEMPIVYAWKSAAEQRQAIPVIRAAGVLNPPTRPCSVCYVYPCDPAAHVFADASGPSEPRTYDEMIADARRAIARFEAGRQAS